MPKTLYFDCFSGISGDMTIGALLDLMGMDACRYLDSQLKTMALKGYAMALETVVKQGITAKYLTVEPFSHDHGHAHDHEDCDCEEHGHTHDECDCNDHEHGHSHDHEECDCEEHEHGHTHSHNTHEHGHTHDHEHEEHMHKTEFEHVHRGLFDILNLINTSEITENAKKMACKMFTLVAEAEAEVHGVEIDEVHFHEVGAVDSIVDIVSTAVLIDYLGVDKIIFSPLSEGHGTVKCAHGIIPVPAPATLKIAQMKQIPLKITQNFGEMVTPTGAAICGTLADGFSENLSGTVAGIGYGAGTKNFNDRANVVRVVLFDDLIDKNDDEVYVLESNIDDDTPEIIGNAMAELFENGAVDVWFESIYMKKNRPAVKLCCIAKNKIIADKLAEIYFEQTSTIGVRFSKQKRYEMTRKVIEIGSKYGKFIAKTCEFNKKIKCIPEFESVKMLAQKSEISVSEMYKICQSIINQMNEE